MTISDADRQLFRAGIAGTKPLMKEDKVPITSGAHARGEPHARPSLSPPTGSDSPTLLQTPIETWVTAETVLRYHYERLTRQQRRAVQQGTLFIEDQLDLHQCTLEQSYTQLMRFIHQCQQRRYQWGLVIHGKGLHSQQNQPLLKSHVNHWLRHVMMIKAFCSAHPRHGGNGAVYIYLRQAG